MKSLENGFCLIGKNDLDLAALFFDKVAVILHIIHAGKFMLIHTEKLSVFFKRKNIGIRVHTGGVQLVKAH